ncbi:uncharacterized protein LOC133896911 [Phragmites australis]|uniref:uncharacterized protein LOC133896911 n=1 Tax=Phragmites australis TaxID=29695 RepID=UPI002D76E170|nr:uncharacterized protein LOC133896911 [Phragmites australis]
MDARLELVLERIKFLRQAGLTSISEEWDLGRSALKGLLRVVTGVADLSWAELPWKEMALCAKPDRVAVQAKLPEFDAQGLSMGAAKSQGRPGAPRPPPALEPSAPEPSAPAGPMPMITAAEAGPPSTTAEPGTPSTMAESRPAGAAAEPEPACMAAMLGSSSVAAEPGPASAAAKPEAQPPSCPELTVEAAPERPSPSESGPSAPSTGWMTERAWEVIGRLEVAMAGEMAQQEAERAALAIERAQLTAAWRVFDSHLAAARAVNEDERRAMEEERKALEEARAEVARGWKALEEARVDHVEGELQRREQDVTIRETNAEITAADLGAREDMLAHREAEAVEVAAVAATREERATKLEVELATTEKALSVFAGQAKLAEAQVLGAGSASAAKGQGLEDRGL